MRKLTFVLAWLVLSIPCSAKIIYVDADAAGANDGTSWADAYNYLQDALFNASSGAEIQVAEGVYKPHLNSYSLAPVSRSDTFRLRNGVTIKGGYAGFGEPDPDVRDIGSYVSVLSGDMNGNDAVVGSPEELLNEPTRADNSYHVVTAIGVDANAVLDGFSITGGQANGGTYEEKYGAGMYNYDASPTVTDCTFSANSALERGGGMYICYGSSRPTLSRCTFTFNQAVIGGGIMSYGVPMLTRCTFVLNVAGLGGGMWSSGGELSRCVFGGNRSEFKGGGIFMSHDTSLTSCMLSGNSADSGGAVFAEDCDITVTGCTVIGNRARYVGGVRNDEGKTFVSSCIIWNNKDADGEDESSQIDTADPPSVNYCCIQGWTGGLGGTGNIGANPLFFQPGHWDTDGAWVDGDYHLLSSSPCINAGDPSYITGPDETDLDGNPRVIGERIDMGVYEFQGPSTWYIDGANGDDNNKGLTPETAFATIQKGIDMSRNGDTVIVLDGIYTGDGNRDLDFGGKAIMVRSKNGPGNCIIDCNGTEADFHRGFYFHNGEDENSIIDGFTITNGVHSTGGGILCTLESSPTIRNNVIKANRVPYDWDGGGGIACRRGASPLIINNIIQDNHCEPGSGGGGIHCYEAGTPRIIHNIVSGNSSSYGGGIEVAIFSDTAVIENNVIVGNTASSAAGIICWGTDHEVTIQNNTITGNTAINAVGGIQIDNGIVTNCIIWDNRDSDGMDESAQIAGSSLAVNYCCIQGWTGGLGGTGNISANPAFVQPGHWDTTDIWVDGDYHLLSSSPCINAGDPSYITGPNETDLDGNDRVICGRIDMGAYEFQGARVIYVDVDATGNNDGTSWVDAYNYLQDALMMASAEDEIRVAEGVYRPDQFVLSARPNLGRMETFQLRNGVVIKGGYAGFGEPDPDARDISFYETVLSGDLNGDDVAVNDPCDLPAEPTKAENSYHVVTGTGTDKTAILDGFTITGGNANGPHDPHRFEWGGGMYCNFNSSPTVINCTFRGNVAVGGGGLYIYWDNNMILTNCVFIGNYGGSGGGMEAMRSRVTLTNCAFSGNAAQNGGGMCNQDGGPTLISCTFSANSAAGSGGGIVNFMSSPTLTNCTLTGNRAERGGAINSFLECTTVVTNSILWANTAAQGSQMCLEDDPHYSSDASISYCNVEGGITGVYVGEGWRFNWGQGNIDIDPCFFEPGYWDADGVWVEGDYRLLKDSVCINAGDPNYVAGPNETDLDGNDRVICGRIDMGAYEFHCPKIVYVDADATGNNDGSSWTDAYNLLQDGLASACEGDEIWVGQGVYKPDQGGGNTSGDREATFQLKNGVGVRGGFAGFDETDPDARDNDLYETILSGDLAGDDVGDLHDASRAENSYHVVTGSGTDASAVLDGFTVTGGNAFNTKCSSNDSGGGMYNSNGSPTVANCTFTRNTASDQCGGGGAGMYNYHSSPMVINCEFVGNEYIIADDDGGGGMNNYRSNPTLIDCSFRDNKSNGDGGGMFNSQSNPTLTNCIFINNSSAHEGGGMENNHSSPALTYCTFISNSAYRQGGGMRNTNWSSPVLIGCAFTGNSVNYGYSQGGGICNNYQDSPTLINCLFTDNRAQQGGGMYSYWGTASLTNCSFSGNSAADRGGAMYYRNVSSTLTNCIVWDNTALQGEEIYFEHFEQPATMTVSYSDIRGGEAGIYVEAGNILDWGDGNIDSEPVFADSGNGNYRLSVGSPCVDAGDNDSVPPDVCDLDGNARIYDGDGDGEPVVDMGAYELGLPPIEVLMKLVPQALNPGSQGKWVKAHFVLPEGYTIEDVDTSRPAEIEQFQLMSESMEVFVNKEDLVEVIAVFDRSAFCSIGSFEGEIAVVGYLTSGRRFLGTDTIKIVTNKLKYLGVLAANWLSVCSAPGWCNGADLDQDSEVNFVDFALLDGCCFEVIED